jgi:ABC-type transport system involved in multi-copper enzyme maturation permease subunit
MLVMPLLALTMGYDQCAGDIENRHVRYLAFRIDRTTLYLGKLLGAWALISLTIAVAAVSMAGYIQVRAGTIPRVADFVYVARSIITVSVAALPLLALLGLLGTLRGRARRVVLLAVLLWLAVAIVAAVARHGLELELLAQVIEVLWPTHGRWDLIFDEWASWGTSAARVVIYSVVAVGLGLAHFRRRDL